MDSKELWEWDSTFLWIGVFYLIKYVYLKGTSHHISFAHKFYSWKDLEIGLGLWTEKQVKSLEFLIGVQNSWGNPI